MNTEVTNEQGAADQDLPNNDAIAHAMDDYLTNGYDYQAPKRGDIRTGVIVDTHDQGLVVDIGSKREGLVPAEDLERLDEEVRAEIQVGISVPVFVLRPEDKEGRPILSIHQARLYEDWLKAEEMMGSGELYEGEVAGFNRGGLIVRFGKIRGFVPASQIVGLPRRLREEQRRERLETMIGDRMGLKIIEVDRHRRRLIFSQRRALRAWQELQRERVITELTEGETRHGQVTSITNFGAFVDLGGADGLIHVSELSWGRVDNPRQVLKVGDEVDVYVLDVDRERKRIALSLKKLQPDPWTIVDDHYRVGELVEGRVTRVLDFGAFVELDLGIEGLLHTSEMIGTPELPPSDIVHPGEKLLVKIIRIESRRRRLALSARQVRKSEWERWIAEQQTAHEAEEAKAREEAARVREAEALEQAAPVQETEASISEQVEVEREAESATEAEAIAPEEEAPVGKVVEEAAPASEPEMEEPISSETEKVAPDEGTDVGSGIQAPEVADGAQAAD
jgi:small subunit ribosomal protein S1